MAQSSKHNISVTDEQLALVSTLFKDKGWSLPVSPSDRFEKLKEAAEEYVVFKASESDVDAQPDASTDAKTTANTGTYANIGRQSPIEATKVEPDPLPPPLEPKTRHVTIKTEASPVKPDPLPPPVAPKTRAIGRSIKIDKNHESFHSMKKVGSYYKQLREKSKDRPEKTESQNLDKKQWRLSSPNPHEADESIDADLAVKHHCVTEGDSVKILAQFSTQHVKHVSKVPVRIVLLVDRSGSMLNKLGRNGRYAKITTVKRFANQLINNLDDGDEAGLVTFGETAEEFFPLQKLTSLSRKQLHEKLQQLDKGSMSLSTNLSDGLRMALKCFYNAVSSPSDYLAYKNSILVFSDGDINAGTIETNALVHEVRQSIRQMASTLDDTQNQWVTISVITTGTDISEQVYTLSKTCSSEAFYYVDQDTIDPEAELFLPVLLRKSAVAWNISCHFEAFHDVSFDNDRCTADNKIRLRRSFSGSPSRAEKAYFLYDFPVGHTRQIGVCANWSKARLKSLDPDEILFKIRIQFTNIKGDRLWKEHTICRQDVEKAMADNVSSAAKMAACKHEIRLVSTDILHAAAENVKSGDKRTCVAVMQNGTKDLQAMLNRYGQHAEEADEESASNAEELQTFARSVVSNLGALVEAIETSTEGAAWNRIKAVSTAISREAPTVAGSMSEGDVLCPLPEIGHMDNGDMYDSYAKLKEHSQQAKSKRITFGNLDQMLDGVFSANGAK